MFIRPKRIKKHEYAYLVRNRWTKKGTRQKARYLGRIHELQKQSDIPYPMDSRFLLRASAREIVESLVSWVLEAHGFKKDKSLLALGDIEVNLNSATVKQGSQDIVLRIGEDYMCRDSLRKLQRFKSDKDAKGVGLDLAKAFIGAGIQVPPEIFVIVFQKTYKEGQSFI
jgi:uncharacterized protein YejL (UPF0352 family)